MQTQQRTKLSYTTNSSFLDKIDSLPTKAPGWTCDIVDSPGDWLTDDGERMPVEKLELWRRDPLECIKELMGNPTFIDAMQFAPERVYTDGERQNRQYDEMWTCDWWWNTQVRHTCTVYMILSNGRL